MEVRKSSIDLLNVGKLCSEVLNGEIEYERENIDDQERGGGTAMANTHPNQRFIPQNLNSDSNVPSRINL